MVLVDPSYPDSFQQMFNSLPPESAGESSEIASCRSNLEEGIDFWKIWHNQESWDLLASSEQVRAIRSLADLPLIVITDIHDNGYQGELGEKEDQIWTNLLAEYAALSTNGTQIITNSGHMLPAINPQVVVDAILQVLEQARRR